jgi:hypothetical protein
MKVICEVCDKLYVSEYGREGYPMSDAALAFAWWTEAEARKHVATGLKCGWTVKQLALMYGTTVADIDRLTGDSDQPSSVAAREVA